MDDAGGFTHMEIYGSVDGVVILISSGEGRRRIHLDPSTNLQ